MSKQVQDAYIVAATRTPIGKARARLLPQHPPRRPADRRDRAARWRRCRSSTRRRSRTRSSAAAFPEAEQGMNMARVAAVLAGLPHSVAGVTVNRFCASGLTALQMAADRIRVGEADVMIAGGAESMSMVPMGGNKPSFNPDVFARDENVGIAYGMGLTAEKVAAQWKVGREAQDAFALQSHQRALKAHRRRRVHRRDDADRGRRALSRPGQRRSRHEDAHREPRRRRAPRHLASKAWPSCKPVFAAKGSVTAGNSSQTSDGAGALILASEKARQAVRPEAAGAFRQLRGARRAARDHGHRPDRGDSGGAALGRAEAGRHRLDRAERGLRRAVAGGDRTRSAWTRRRSTRWAARSRSATRSARPARSAPRPWCTRCAATS